jgi:hypothetical protein
MISDVPVVCVCVCVCVSLSFRKHDITFYKAWNRNNTHGKTLLWKLKYNIKTF